MSYKYLIFGATGSIGSSLAHQLKDSNQEAHLISRNEEELKSISEKLGFSLANSVAISSPKLIVLFGGLAQSGNLLIKPTKKYLEEYLLSIFKNKIEIVPSKLNASDAAILGASALAWQQ